MITVVKYANQVFASLLRTLQINQNFNAEVTSFGLFQRTTWFVVLKIKEILVDKCLLFLRRTDYSLRLTQ